jgi:hypothetical protein
MNRLALTSLFHILDTVRALRPFHSELAIQFERIEGQVMWSIIVAADWEIRATGSELDDDDGFVCKPTGGEGGLPVKEAVERIHELWAGMAK